MAHCRHREASLRCRIIFQERGPQGQRTQCTCTVSCRCAPSCFECEVKWCALLDDRCAARACARRQRRAPLRFEALARRTSRSGRTRGGRRGLAPEAAPSHLLLARHRERNRRRRLRSGGSHTHTLMSKSMQRYILLLCVTMLACSIIPNIGLGGLGGVGSSIAAWRCKALFSQPRHCADCKEREPMPQFKRNGNSH